MQLAPRSVRTHAMWHTAILLVLLASFGPWVRDAHNAFAREDADAPIIKATKIVRVRFGKTVPVRLDRRPLLVKFVKVVADTRCPRNVVCVQAGGVAIEIEVRGIPDRRTPTRITLALDPTNPAAAKYDVIDGRYLFQLLRVSPELTAAKPQGSPASVAAQQVPRSRYVVTLQVSKIGKRSTSSARAPREDRRPSLPPLPRAPTTPPPTIAPSTVSPPTSTRSAAPMPNLSFNGQTFTTTQLDDLRRTYGALPPNGRYWYDAASGLWGPLGGPAAGFIRAGHNEFGALASDASRGNTGVFLNGRELPTVEVTFFQRIFGEVPLGRWWMDGQGNIGVEGISIPTSNLQIAMAQAEHRAEGRAGELPLNDGGGTSYYYNNVAGSASGGVSGGCVWVNIPGASAMSSGC